jgi:biotin carboxyl carrier protein
MKLIVQIGSQEHHVDLADPAAVVEEVETGVYSVLRDGRSYEIVVRETPGEVRDGALDVYVNGNHYVARVSDPRRLSRKRGGALLEGRQNVLAPMPGKVVRLLVAVGDEVTAGQGLMVVEAMKMQNEIKSPKAGKIVAIAVAEGVPVNPGQVLLSVE